ncbi:protein kinase domain-containing protein [Janthinobacterium sp.]|uniref:protein kinase domain-containing protein n=1 Tax=Janthinobacterium sp. TaxID=1871054 RepID=UPI00293D5AFD|nr:protein kinase [Janthinobacterium sp.]
MERPQPSPAISPPDDERSGHYQILRRLGEGGYGQVFEAWDPKLGRSVALKRLKALPSGAQSARLMEEGRLAASLRHAAFVKIFSIEGDGDAQSIVMEMVQGVTLRQFAQDKVLADALALDIVRQVAEAMAEAHEANLVHGDIKPSNLMVEPGGRVRILDFGLARQIDPLATQESCLAEETPGTISYMSTERLLGQAPSAQGDVYSLGVVLYELIAGQRPFPHLNGLALAGAHIQTSSESWTLPLQADAALVALMRAMTAREVAQRSASMRAVVEAIDALQGAGAAPAHTGPLPIPIPQQVDVAAPRPGRLRRMLPALRGRGRWAAGALALLLGVAALAGYERWQPAFALPYSETASLRQGMDALRVFDRDDNLDKAIGRFTTILEKNPAHAGAAAGLSLAYSLRYASDSYDEVWLQRADASAQQALKQNDQLALAYAALAWVREHQGHAEESLQLEARALSLDPRNWFALAGQAELLLRLRRFDAVERTLRTAMAAYPKESLFTNVLGTLRFDQGDYVAAEQQFRLSIQLDPDSSTSYANLNMALLSQGRDDDALHVAQQGLQLRPNSRLYRNIGTAMFARGDYIAAARAFESAVSASKGSPNLYIHWANLADTLRWIPGRGDDARDAYRQASALLKPLLARKPNDVLIQSRMGLYCAKLGDAQGAAHWSRRAVESAPNDANVHFRAAVAYEVSGDRDSALSELERAKELGYAVRLIDTEPDLLALRRDSRYHHPTKKAP